MSQRVDNHPILGPLPEQEVVSFQWKGQTISAVKGEPIAAALLAAGIRKLRSSEVSGSPRGVYCAIGQCMECRVTVNGVPGIRACLTPVSGGEDVTS